MVNVVASLVAGGVLVAAVSALAAAAAPSSRASIGHKLRSSRVLPLRVPDPAGGPPWGLRQMVTRSGLGCLQVGRIVDGRLGDLGVDGAHGDDGAFHPLPPVATDCQPPDAAGHVFLTTRYHGLPRSASFEGCRVRDERKLPDLPPDFPTPEPNPDPCARTDVRIINYGLIGPQAASITYKKTKTRTVTEDVSGPDGAFLVVRRPLPVDEVSGGFSPGAEPVRGTFSSARYADGSQCRLKPVFGHGTNSCPARGYVKSTAPIPTADQLATKVHATLSRAALRGEKLYRVRVAFRAKVAATDGAYYVLTSVARGRNGHACTGLSAGSIRHDVHAGDREGMTFYAPRNCHGTVSGTVGYQPAPEHPTGGGPYSPDPFSAIPAGRYRVRTQ